MKEKRIVTRLTMFLLGGVIFLLPLLPVAGNLEAAPRSTIIIAVNPVGTATNIMGVGIADILTRYGNLNARVGSYAGNTAWLPLLDDGSAHLGIMNCFETWEAYNAMEAYNKITRGKGYNLRLIRIGTPSYASMIVAANSGIKSFSDLKGKKWAYEFKVALAAKKITDTFMEVGNISPSEVKLIPTANTSSGVQSILDGTLHTSMGIDGMGAVSELDSRLGALFLPLPTGQKTVDILRKYIKGSDLVTVKGGSFTGVKVDTPLLSYNQYLLAGTGVSDEEAYGITKALWENADELVKTHRNLQTWTNERALSDNFTIPYHPQGP
jgi:uncharacterized protein